MSELSGYRLVWVITFFDLPVLTKRQRKAAADYRKYLLKRGYQMAQLSVYFKYCYDKEQGDRVIRDVSASVPGEGKVDSLMITDKQYSNIVTVMGDTRVERENPSQLGLF